jgi:hypothetical protein
MRVSTISMGLSVLAVAGAIAGTVAAAPSSSHRQSVLPGCTHTALAPYVDAVQTAAGRLLAQLAKEGGSTSPMSSIVIALGNGQRLRFAFNGSHFRVSGTAVPAACKRVTGADDWGA